MCGVCIIFRMKQYHNLGWDSPRPLTTATAVSPRETFNYKFTIEVLESIVLFLVILSSLYHWGWLHTKLLFQTSESTIYVGSFSFQILFRSSKFQKSNFINQGELYNCLEIVNLRLITNSEQTVSFTLIEN